MPSIFKSSVQGSYEGGFTFFYTLVPSGPVFDRAGMYFQRALQSFLSGIAQKKDF